MSSVTVTGAQYRDSAEGALSGLRLCAVVVGGIPHPTRGASTVLMFHYLDRLLSAGVEVACVLIVPPDDGAATEAVEALTAHAAAPDRLRIMLHRRQRCTWTHRFVLHDESRAVADDISREIEQFAPDALLCFDLEAAAIGRFLPASLRMVWLGDLHFQTTWHHALYSVSEHPHRAHELAYAAAQSLAWRRLYRRVLPHYEMVVVSSHSSEAQLARLGIGSFYAPYPWPALALRHKNPPPPPPDRPTFVFFGNLLGLGSRSSMRMLADRIVPLLYDLWGSDGFQIRIAGRETLPARWRSRLAALPEIKVLGFVEDLHAEIAGAHAVLAPLDVPVGNRSRILTALSVAAPVIAHRNAALGNPDLVHNETCFLAADAHAFVRHMRICVEEPAAAAAIGKAGKAMYFRRFEPAAAAGLFVGALRDRLMAVNKRG